jgi:hypothetical protein
MSLAAARSITHVRLASFAGVLWFDGPALVSLTLLLLEPMVVPDFHGVQEEGEFGVQREGVFEFAQCAMEIGPIRVCCFCGLLWVFVSFVVVVGFFFPLFLGVAFVYFFCTLGRLSLLIKFDCT